MLPKNETFSKCQYIGNVTESLLQQYSDVSRTHAFLKDAQLYHVAHLVCVEFVSHLTIVIASIHANLNTAVGVLIFF